MTKKKNKPTDTKLSNETISKNAESEFKKDNTPPTDKESKTSSSETPSTEKKTYVRGESQKPVTKAYRNNWNSIFHKG